MRTLDNLYREEMHYLKALAEVIAKEQPHLKEFVAPDHSDAFVEHLLEAFSLLSADFKKHLISAFPEITVDYLNQVSPFLINPIPMTTILHFEHSNSNMINGLVLEKESQIEFTDGHINGVLRTARRIMLTPISILNRACYTSANTSEIQIECCFNGKHNSYPPQQISFYLGNNSALAKKLQYLFFQKLHQVFIMVNGEKIYISSEYIFIDYPSENNYIIPRKTEQNWPLQTFIEGIYLPHVYDFIHVTLPSNFMSFFSQEDQTFEFIFTFDEDIELEHDALAESFYINCVPAYCLQENQHANISLRTGYQHEARNLSTKEFSLFEISNVNLVARDGSLNTWVIKPSSSYHPRYSLLDEQHAKQYFYTINTVFINQNKSEHFLEITDNHNQFVPDIDGYGCTINYTITNIIEKQLLPKTLICDPILADDDISCSNISPTTRYYPAVLEGEKHWPLISFIAQSPFFLNEIEVIKQSIKAFSLHGHLDINLDRKINQYAKSLINIQSSPIDRLVKDRVRRGYHVKLFVDEQIYDNESEIYFFSYLLTNLFCNTISDKCFILLDVLNLHGKGIVFIPQLNGQRKSL